MQYNYDFFCSCHDCTQEIRKMQAFEALSGLKRKQKDEK